MLIRGWKYDSERGHIHLVTEGLDLVPSTGSKEKKRKEDHISTLPSGEWLAWRLTKQLGTMCNIA